MITILLIAITVIVMLISGLIAIFFSGVGASDYICSISCAFLILQVGLTYDKDDDGAIGVWGAVSILVFIFLWWFTTFSILGTWVDSMDISRLGNLATAVFLSTGIGMFVLGRYIRKSRFYSDFIWGDMMF